MNMPRLNCLRGLFVVLLFTAAFSVQALEPGQLDYRAIKLENGLQVITLEDFSCPIVAVDLWYHVGSKDENPERQGFAHMFEHMMFRGTDRLGPTSHFDLTRQIGGNCNGYTSFDQTVYVQTVPANQLELVLWLEAERMSFLKIDQASFDTERKVVEEERRLRLNAPYGTVEEEGLAEIFKVHPYRWTPIGKIPHLRASTVPELREFWTRNYIPNNATLVIAGAVKHEDAQELAERYFGWIPRYPEPPRVEIREPMPDASHEVTLKQDNAPIPLVAIVYRTVPLNSEDSVALDLLSTILGGGNSSRVYRELVAKKQLAVGIQSMDMSLEQDGILGVGAALTAAGAKDDAALIALRKQVDALRNRKVKPRELEKAKNQTLKNLVTENLQVARKASVLGRAAVLEGDVARVNARLDAVRRTTADDLLRVAKQYLDPNRAFTFHVERNLRGMLGKKTHPEDETPITGQPETNPPPPGRPGEARPADFPETPPMKEMLEFDPTPHFQSKTLANGLKVVVVENHEVPFVSMSLGLEAGAWTESKPGCASMAASMLRKGTRKHSEAKLAEELETYAIGLGAYAGMDTAMVNANCVTDQVERAAMFMAEIVMTPTFKATEFEKLRKQVISDLAIASAEPNYLAECERIRRMYGEHPYGRMVQGQVKDVKALEPKDPKEWWSTFARPDMACLLFSGDITFERAIELAEKAFGTWKCDTPKPEVKVAPIPEAGPTHIYIVDKPGDQAQIRIGQLGITIKDPRYFTSRVVNGYFGGSFGSRLNETLRVKKGLTYGAGGGFRTQHMAGEFGIYTFTKIESVADAVQTSIDEIKRLQSEGPSERELHLTKAYTLGSFAGQRETPQAIANDLWMIESEGLPEDHFRQLLQAVQNTDADGCIQLAQSTLDPGKLVVVVVGPAEALKPKLEAIAPVTVVEREEQGEK